MKNVHYSTTITGPKEKVWDVMLGESSYREWASVFMPGSFFKGSWQKGTSMDFLAADESGVESGMRANVVDSIPYEFVSLQHVSELKDGEEIPFNTDGGSFENYTFKEHDGITDVTVDLLNIPDEWVEMMGDLWPKAFTKLKEIAERS